MIFQFIYSELNAKCLKETQATLSTPAAHCFTSPPHLPHCQPQLTQPSCSCLESSEESRTPTHTHAHTQLSLHTYTTNATINTNAVKLLSIFELENYCGKLSLSIIKSLLTKIKLNRGQSTPVWSEKYQFQRQVKQTQHTKAANLLQVFTR